jgi:16S rRNA (cytosine1402-N4)-methyltransferase
MMELPSHHSEVPHQPVLYKEIIHALEPQRGGFYVDCTLGAGGHAWGLLNASDPDGQLLGLDIDPQAIELARERLAEFGSRVRIVRASYTTLSEQLQKIRQPTVDGIIIDLGVSSMQLDQPERGFSFLTDAPLDMRFDPGNPITAADLVNQLPTNELADLLYRYGEERQARRIARHIVQARPIKTTGDLARIIAGAVRGERQGIHPATRSFQALRIEVNQELAGLEKVLPQAVNALNAGGRLAVISFHSLEDRIVKQYFRRESRDCICPPRQPICTCGHRASIEEINRKPVEPRQEEILQNPRSRSARLRVVKKLYLA